MTSRLEGRKEVPVKELPWEKRFNTLSQINRLAHFEWREAALSLCPDLDPKDLVLKYWEIVGRDTGRAYLRHIDRGKPVAPQIARSFVWSSVSMGEDAHLYEGDDEREAYMLHQDCPWLEFHKRFDALAEDRPGCDRWLESLIAVVNEELGSKVRFETLESLPEGGSGCVRRVWDEG
jgi:hypothetical protein